jgi:D-sedoheptulose 7-phosphate isomerase
MGHSENFLITSSRIIENLMMQFPRIDKMIDIVDGTRTRGGRLFIIGMGGSAAHASHAVNDFRKLCNIEAYAPTDNVSEITARANDEGLNTIFSEWLKVSMLNSDDCIFIFSVGGGDIEKNVSRSIVNAIDLAKERGARIIGIVGRDGGYTAKNADACVIIPTIDASQITPQTEGMQAVIWHLMVSSPKLQENKTKW